MTHIRKEFYFHHIEFMHTLRFSSFVLQSKTHSRTSYYHLSRKKQNGNCQADINHISKWCLPERRKNSDLKSNSFIIPVSVIVCGFYFKYVLSRIEIGVCCSSYSCCTG